MYDSIIIGAGPAGLTAALYLARKRINFLLLTEDLGGQAAMSGNVENYPGYQSIAGADLMDRFQNQIKDLGIGITYDKVISITKGKNLFKIKTDKQEYSSRTVIVASGKLPRRLGVPGEEELKGRGVAYCATCDAPNFKDMPVAVIGGANSALDSVLQLAKYTQKIYLINLGAKLEGDAYMQEKVKSLGFVKILHHQKTLAIKGKDAVSAIELEDIKRGRKTILKVQGVFINIGFYPATGFKMPVKLNNRKEIIVDKNCATSVPGFFAAGDVTDVRYKQIIIACGEGAKAALSAYDYLIKNH